MEPYDFLARLDKADNEAEVRQRLASGNYSQHHKALAQEWLRRKEEVRASASSTRAEAREQESLLIAKEANSIAWRALRAVRNDRIMTIIAIAIAAIAARDDIKWLISWLIDKIKTP